MRKNTASQTIGGQMVTASDGSVFTGAVTAYVTVDAGTQAIGSVGSGVCTHEGNGYHTYAPAQAETNGDLLGFTFIGTGAVPATVQVFTTGNLLLDVNDEVDTGISDFWTTPGTLVDLVWDEVNTTGAHNVNNSTGKQLREGTASIVISSDTCQATGQTTTNVRLAASENSTDNVYRHKRIVIVAGTNVGFDAIVSSYAGTGKDCTITPAFPAACDNTSEYEIVGAIVHTATSALGYQNGSVWIDTVGGVAGTELYVNGTADNPVDSIADAKTIADMLNIKVFHTLPGSSYTLATTFDSYEFIGAVYTIALGGQSIVGAKIVGATLSGTFTDTNAIWEDCIINAVTGPGITMRRCFFNEVTLTNNGTAGWFLNDCRSRVAGTGSPNFDFGAAVGASGLSVRDYSGGIEIENMATGDTASIEGQGAITINANCTAGTLARRGNWDYNDNASGAVTVVPDDESAGIAAIEVDTDNIQTRIPAALVSGRMSSDMVAISGDTTAADNLEEGATGLVPLTVNDAGASTTAFICSSSEATDDHFNGRIVTFTTGALAGQSTDITDYTGATKTLTVTALTEAPANGVGFVIS